MFDYKNLTGNEKSKIKKYFFEKIQEVKSEEKDSTSQILNENLEKIFTIIDELLSLSKEERISVIEELLAELLEQNDILGFDIFNNIIIELMLSGYIDKDGAETPYTLLFFPVISTDINNNIDKIHQIIKTSCVKSGMNEHEDDVIPMEQILPYNFQATLGIKDFYDYISQFFSKEKTFFTIPNEIIQQNNTLYYIPVFVKGDFNDTIYYIAENNSKITYSIDEITDSIIEETSSEIFSPILWSEATPTLLETIFIDRTSFAQIKSFCINLSNIDKNNKEISVVRVKENDENDENVLLLLLDKKKAFVLNAKLVLGLNNFLEDALLPLMQHAIINKIPMSMPEERISLNSAMNLLGNKEVDPQARDELVKILNDTGPVEDLETLYQLYSGATMRIQ